MLAFIQIAKKEAEKSSLCKQFGAVLIYRNKIIAKGYNYSKSIGLYNNCLL